MCALQLEWLKLKITNMCLLLYKQKRLINFLLIYFWFYQGYEYENSKNVWSIFDFYNFLTFNNILYFTVTHFLSAYHWLCLHIFNAHTFSMLTTFVSATFVIFIWLHCSYLEVHNMKCLPLLISISTIWFLRCE